jgi:hypothetical protein
MLAEISLAPGISGAGWTIQQAAAYRNMEFGPLSKWSVPATITLRGLQKVTGAAADRDVYLYVETHNLPPRGREPIQLSHADLAAARAYSLKPPPRPPTGKGGRPPPNAEAGRTGPAPGKPVAPPVPPVPPTLLELPLLTGEQALTQVFPTYRILAYYDSGKTTTIKGKVQKVLIPMAPFGFYMSHEGPFFGFSHKLEFLDAQWQEIAPNLYLVHVGNEGSFRVKTSVEAEEQVFTPPPPPTGANPPPPPPTTPPLPPTRTQCSCDMVRSTPLSPAAFLAGGLGLAVLFIRVRRRKR